MNTSHFRAGLMTAFTATALLGAIPGDVDAQRTYRSVKERFFTITNWSIDGSAGYGDIGRLLLQNVDDRQRELNPGGGFSWGLGAGVMILDRTQVRIGFTRMTGDLEYKDDTGDDRDVLDADDLGDIGASVLALELGQYFFGDRTWISPYARLGIAIAWWGLDNDDELDFFEDGGETRWGGTGAIGVQFRVVERVSLRLEAATAHTRNPFTGKESFIPATGFTIDEPYRVSANVFRVMVAYNLGKPRPFDTERR